jgi:hypothetical protein
MTVKNTLLTMHDDELGYEIFANVFIKSKQLWNYFSSMPKNCLDHLELQ